MKQSDHVVCEVAVQVEALADCMLHAVEGIKKRSEEERLTALTMSPELEEWTHNLTRLQVFSKKAYDMRKTRIF